MDIHTSIRRTNLNRKSQHKKWFHGSCFLSYQYWFTHCFSLWMKTSGNFKKKIHFSTAIFEGGKWFSLLKLSGKHFIWDGFLNIILKEVCIRRRILMLIFKYFHISSWAYQVDNYMHWPMCLECYRDRHKLAFGFQWSRLYQISHDSSFILWLVSLYFLKILSPIHKLGCLQKEKLDVCFPVYIQKEGLKVFRM